VVRTVRFDRGNPWLTLELENDDVVAVRMFHEIFQFFNDGRSAVLAVILFVAVLPLMLLNVRQMKNQGLPA